MLITAPVRVRAGRELAYALLMPLMAGLGLVYLLVVLLSVIATANIVGVPLLALCVVGARGLGAVNRGLARALAGAQVPAPAPFRSRPGPFDRLAAALGDVVGWRAVIHSLVRLPAAVLAFGVAAGLWGYGLLLLSCPLWWRTAAPADITATTWEDALLLAPGAARIRTLEQTRALAVDDAAAALRRIERDLHDGTAARLVALAMRLGMAQEELAEADRPERLERARSLVDGAHREAKETLTELRVLTRGIHPPALDKGLEIALATLAARSPIPVALEADLPERPSPAVESIAFFCTAELLANVTKHSGARRAAVELRTRAGLLTLLVRDDGTGGAMMDAGSGLRGLADRVRMVDGRLDIRSPAGGPTVVTVELPLYI